jgi:hypothetical protein
MLISVTRTAGHYRLQAAHIREFLDTVHDDDELRSILLDAAARFDQMAAQQTLPLQTGRRPRRARIENVAAPRSINAGRIN